MRPEPPAAARRTHATNRAPNRAGVRCAGCRRSSLVDEKRATASSHSQVDLADRNCAQSSSIQLCRFSNISGGSVKGFVSDRHQYPGERLESNWPVAKPKTPPPERFQRVLRIAPHATPASSRARLPPLQPHVRRPASATEASIVL